MGASYRIIRHLERIGDYSKDITFAIDQYTSSPQYSEETMKKISGVSKKIEGLLQKTFDLFNDDAYDAERIAAIQLRKDEIAESTEKSRFLVDIGAVRIVNNLRRINSNTANIALILNYRENLSRYEEEGPEEDEPV